MKTKAELSKKAILGIWILMAAAMLMLVLFNHTESIPAVPQQSPEEFLNSVPYTVTQFAGKTLYITQPSSSVFVHLLGILMIAAGIYFVVKAQGQRSRLNLGTGFIFWGASAILAGLSYQTFTYHLKYAGREYGIFTSIFELEYLITTAFAISFIIAGMAYSFLTGKKRKKLLYFSVIFCAVYFVFLFLGTAIPVKLFVTYEFFVAFMAVIFIVAFIVCIKHYKTYKDKLSRDHIIIYISFLVVNAGYFIYLLSGAGEVLLNRYNIWFNANDVLHILLILWLAEYFFMLKDQLKDEKQISE